MKNKKIAMGVLIFAVVILMLILTGCEAPTARELKDESIMQATYNDNLEEVHELVKTIELEDFNLLVRYDTIDYDLKNWRITDNKVIRMEVMTEGLPSDWEAIIEHVHVDMFVRPDTYRRPYLLQDSMDDSFHGYGQDGFIISDSIKYNNIFSIIGGSEELNIGLNGGEYVLMSLEETDFTKYGYTNNEMQVIYDVMVKKAGENYFETIAVYDKVVIPTSEGQLQ